MIIKLKFLTKLFIGVSCLMIYNQNLLLPQLDEIQYAMMSFSGIGQKIIQTIKKTTLIVLGGYGGVICNNYTTQGKRTEIYKTATINTHNYDENGLALIENTVKCYQEKDIEGVYNNWRLSMLNPDGILSCNYGRLGNTLEVLNNVHNFDALPGNKVKELDFFEHCDIEVKDMNFEITKNNTGLYNSAFENLTLKYLNSQNSDVKYLRNANLNLDREIANLCFQGNADYVVAIRFDVVKNKYELCYIDFKRTDRIALSKKLEDLDKKGFGIEYVPGSKQIFGCDIYLVATRSKDLILNQREKDIVLNMIAKIAVAQPKFFKDYKNSPEYQEFERTGNFNILLKCKFPFPKGMVNENYNEIFNVNIKTRSEYLEMIKKSQELKNGRSDVFSLDELEHIITKE